MTTEERIARIAQLAGKSYDTTYEMVVDPRQEHWDDPEAHAAWVAEASDEEIAGWVASTDQFDEDESDPNQADLEARVALDVELMRAGIHEAVVIWGENDAYFDGRNPETYRNAARHFGVEFNEDPEFGPDHSDVDAALYQRYAELVRECEGRV